MASIGRFAVLLALTLASLSCGGGDSGGGSGGGGGGNGNGGGGSGNGGNPPGGGTPDIAFTNLQQQAGGTVHAIAPAGDGSGDVYVGGAFRTYNTTLCGGIVRINVDGTVDPGFAPGGGFSLIDPPGFPFPLPPTAGVCCVATANDGTGDLYVGGRLDTYAGTPVGNVARLNADGTLDAAFAPTPQAAGGATASVRRIVRANDGSGDIYILLINTPGAQVVRLNADGSVDPAFNGGTGFNSTSTFDLAAAADASGDLYVAGGFTTYNGAAVQRVVRLNANGTLDAAFNCVAFAGNSAQIFCVAPVANGDVYVGGGFSAGALANRLLRLNSDGTFDAGFGTGAGFNDAVHAIMLDAAGVLWVGGRFTLYGAQTANGAATLTPTGAFIASGNAGFSSWVTAFAPSGIAPSNVWAGGAFCSFNGTPASGLCRLNAAVNGVTLDTSCATGGGLELLPNAPRVLAVAPAADGSGDVYVGGEFVAHTGGGVNRLVRVNANGTRDDTFLIGAGFGPVDQWVGTIVPMPDGDVYVGGSFTTFDGAPAPGLVRLNSNGTLDAGFTTPPAPFTPQFPLAVMEMTPVGGGSPDFYVAAATGVFRMAPNGVVSGAFAPVAGAPQSIAVVPDGSGDVMIAMGTAGVLRRNANGTADAGLPTGGFAPPASITVVRASTDGSGMVYVGGTSASYNGVPVSQVVRLSANGTLDQTFAPAPFAYRGLAVVIHDILPLPDGDVIVAGRFETYGGAPAGHIVRLNADGSLDWTFATGGGFSNEVTSVALLPGAAGELVAGGNFHSFNTTSSRGVIALNPDGSVD